SGLLTYLVAKTLADGWATLRWLWVVTGVLTALSSANLTVCFGAALVVVCGVELWRTKRTNDREWGEVLRIHVQSMGIVVIAVVATLAAWGARNYVALGKVIPLKSNLWYEAY